MALRFSNACVGGEIVDVLVDGEEIARFLPASGEVSDDTENYDLAGRVLSPGLWDQHVHFSQWALTSRRLDVSVAASAQEVADAVAARLASGGEVPEPLVGVGFRDGLWPDAPNRAVLDAASGAHPVAVLSGDLHSIWLNSAALRLYGHEGHPTGLLREDDAFEVTRRINTVDPLELDAWAFEAATAAARKGVVGIVDFEMDWNLETWTRRIGAGADQLRVEMAVYSEHLDRAIELGLRSGKPVGPLLGMGNFKVLIDGSLNTRTAYCFDDYPGLEQSEFPNGMLTVAPDELRALMLKATRAGILPAVHAIGDKANTIALDAFEALGTGGRIEHAQLVRPADVPRFARLGVAASVQPDHAMDDRDVADRYWHGRTKHVMALRSLADAKAIMLFGSDAPVSPLDPWRTMSAAVGRSREGRAAWHPEQRVTAREALAASTRTIVAPWERADLIVTDVDPATATAEQLSRMHVHATLLGGRFTHNELELARS